MKHLNVKSGQRTETASYDVTEKHPFEIFPFSGNFRNDQKSRELEGTSSHVAS